MKKIKHFFIEEDGGKNTLKKKNLIVFSLVLFTLGIIFSLLPKVLNNINNTDTSKIKKSSMPIADLEKKSSPEKGDNDTLSSENLGGISTNKRHRVLKANSQNRRKKSRINIVYKASQVIQRGNKSSSNLTGLGTNVIGKLLTSIDTRSLSQQKVILPYGVRSKNSKVLLPKGTIIFGNPTYSESSKKVFINFDKGILPDGKSISLNAQALNTKDYTVGIKGDFHSNTTNRIASVLGLSMVSGVTEVLVEKESLGQSFNPTPKANLKNGLYNGVSKVANMEANIKAEELARKPEYVTIEVGEDIIVSLLSISR